MYSCEVPAFEESLRRALESGAAEVHVSFAEMQALQRLRLEAPPWVHSFTQHISMDRGPVLEINGKRFVADADVREGNFVYHRDVVTKLRRHKPDPPPPKKPSIWEILMGDDE